MNTQQKLGINRLGLAVLAGVWLRAGLTEISSAPMYVKW